MWVTRGLVGALVCVYWAVLVVAFGSDSTSAIIQWSFFAAIVGAVALPIVAWMLAILDHGLPRRKRLGAIGASVVLPVIGIALFVSFVVETSRVN
jgi:hypothetical protein